MEQTSYYVVDVSDPADPGACFGDDFEAAVATVREMRGAGLDARIFGGHLGWDTESCE